MINEIYKKVTGHTPPFHIIIKWPWQFGGAITFWCFILTKYPENIPLTCHELVHVEQYYKYPLTFPFIYFYQLYKDGYRGMQLENEAREVQNKVATYLLRGNI